MTLMETEDGLATDPEVKKILAILSRAQGKHLDQVVPEEPKIFLCPLGSKVFRQIHKSGRIETASKCAISR